MVIPLPTQTMPVFLGMTCRVYLSGCGQSSTMILCKKGPPCLCGPPWTNDWLPWKNISDLDADELEFMAVQLPTLKKSMRHGSTRDVETLSYKIRRHCTATLAVGRDAPRVGVDLTCHREHDLAAGWSGLQPIDVPQMVYLDPFPHRATDMPGQVTATVAGLKPSEWTQCAWIGPGHLSELKLAMFWHFRDMFSEFEACPALEK